MYSVDHVSYCGEASVCTNIGVYICVCSVMRFPRTHSRRTQNAHTPGAHKLPPAQVRRNAGARNWGGAQVHRKIHILGTPRSCVSGGEFPHTRTNTLAGNLHCVHFLKEPAGCAREWEAQMHHLCCMLAPHSVSCEIAYAVRIDSRIQKTPVLGPVPFAYLAT